MSKFTFVALAAILASAGVAAPAFAAPSVSETGTTPYCATGTNTDYASRMDTLAAQLQLSSKQGASIDQWAGCLKVTTIEDGKSTVAFYDPDSLALVATL
jgi:hypothetical protein